MQAEESTVVSEAMLHPTCQQRKNLVPFGVHPVLFTLSTKGRHFRVVSSKIKIELSLHS
jgi:hypothetical protein